MRNTLSVNEQHKIFVASSLTLEEVRKTVDDVVDGFNKNENVPIKFQCIRFETCSEILQVADKQDAQRQIDALLCDCSIFFLVIDETIGDITRYEFELALSRFRSGMMPYYLFIFKKKSTEGGSVIEGGYKYENLLDDYGMKVHKADMLGNLVPHLKVYDIPFTNQGDLRQRVLEQLGRLQGKLPPKGSKLGKHLVKDDFYSDVLRKDRFPDHFYYRPIDDDLRKKMERCKMVLVTGYSLSGKTRSVMEALKEVEDGWVYAIGDKTDNLLGKMELLKRYMQVADHLKLYIEIDNLDQHLDVDESDAFLEAFGDLINVIMDGDNGTIVVTASNYDSINECLQLEDYTDRFFHIRMPKQSPSELRKAVKWFRSCGVETIAETNSGFNQIGALFVNLDKLKSLYKSYLKKDETIRRSILKSIKAQSIWRSDEFGNQDLLRSMTEYFVIKDNPLPGFSFSAFQQSLEELCRDGKMGVTQGHGRIVVEEYVYRYILGYDGDIISDRKNKEMVEMEMELCKEILCYCQYQSQSNPNWVLGGESLTRQVSKIVRRCDHSSVITKKLYAMWSGDGGDELALALQADRKEYEKESETNPSERESHFYSGIVKKYLMVTSEESIKNHLLVYECVPTNLRVDELFATLMRLARIPEERRILKEHADYRRFGSMPCTVFSEIAWAESFDERKALLEKVKKPCEGYDMPQLAEKMLDNVNKPYPIFYYGKMLRKLVWVVHTEEEFEELCELLKENVMCLIHDRELLYSIKSRRVVLQKDGLTIIDLLGLLGWWAASQCVINVYGDNLESCERIVSKLVNCVGQTLSQKLTNEMQVRMVVSTICSRLIDHISGREDYDEVYETLFVPLEIEHPLHIGRKMILRSIYTYTAMMKCRGADVRTSMNLFTNDLVRHVQDEEGNPLSVTCYTLNTMLAMCKNEKRKYLDQINALYDMLEIERDIFAYNILIEVARDLQTVRKILETMDEKQVRPNVYTYLNILRNPDVNFQDALWLLSSSDCCMDGITVQGGLPEILPDKETLQQLIKDIFSMPSGEFNYVRREIKNKHREQLEDMTIQQILHLVKQAWVSLFSKPLEDEDLVAYESCLKHLHENHRELLEDNYIFNTVIKNSTFIESLDETLEYMEREPVFSGFQPDGYTADALLSKALLFQGIDQKIAANSLNEFLKSHPDCLTPLVITHRIKLFRKQDDSIEFVFFEKNDVAINDTYSPIGYLEQMCKLRIPLTSYVLSSIMSIEGKKPYDKIAELLGRQTYYDPSFDDICTVRELIMPYTDSLPEVYGRKTTMVENKNIAWHFKRKPFGMTVTKEEVIEALERLDWKDANSALCALNDILGFYVFRQCDDGMFDNVYGLYKKYVIENNRCSGPTSFTFNVLAKSLTVNNAAKKRNILIKEIKEWSDRVTLHPYLLMDLAKTAKTVEELIKIIQAIEVLGCRPTTQNADAIVFFLNRNLMQTDKENASQILTDLLHYVFGEREEDKDRSVLVKNGRDSLMLEFYAESDNFSVHLLQTLLVYNFNLSIKNKNKYSEEYLVQRTMEIVPDNTIAALMNRLVKDRNNLDLARVFVPMFFNKDRNYSDSVLEFIVGMLPLDDKVQYDKTLESFYTYNCTIPESVIPLLLERLPSDSNDPEILKSLRKIYTNIVMNYLRQGDMLCQSRILPVTYQRWCHRSLECIGIRGLLEENHFPFYGNLVKLFFQRRETLTRKEYKALVRTQDKYIILISNGETNVDELERLPDIWRELVKFSKEHWKPKERLLLSIVGEYANHPFRAAWYNASLGKSIAYAVQHNCKDTRIWYGSIGVFSSNKAYFGLVPTKELKKVMPHPFIVDLCRKMFDTVTYTKEQNKAVKTHEYSFVKQLQKGMLNESVLDELPSLLSHSAWISPGLESELAKRLSSKNYIELIEYIAQLDLKEGSHYLVKLLNNAGKEYASRVKLSQVPYRELAGLPDQWKAVNIAANNHWSPSKELILALIYFYSKIPDVTARQLLSIKDSIGYADSMCWENTRVRYSGMGESVDDTFIPVFLPVSAVREVLPHPYILDLCRLSLQLKTNIKQLKAREIEYLEWVNNGKVDKLQLIRLPELWRKAKWVPLEDLIIKRERVVLEK